MKEEVYISIDVETDGPIPGPHSMLSLGAVALLRSGRTVGEFEVNLQELEGASGHPETLAWWKTQPPEIWQACRAEAKPPEAAMAKFVEWVEVVSAKGKPVCVAYPAGFDFMFVYWYLMKFCGKSPFSFSCIDMKSYTMAVLDKPFRECSKKNMPATWFKGLPPHNHVAIDDAREQGLLFINMMRTRQER